jgi:abequosyltransferase
MTRLLTIGLPTFNRAALLDGQLAWLAGAIKGLEDELEIIVTDNCSPDNTQEVIEKWRPAFNQTVFKTHRQPENVGAIRNISYCINSATSKYVWTISDDDHIDRRAVAYVVGTLADHPDLSLIILNFSSRNEITGEILYDRCFSIQRDEVAADGKTQIEACIEERVGGVALTTALVYRSDSAQRALREWPASETNLAFQIYISAYCALQGKVKVTQDTFLECVAGTHFWREDKQIFLSFRYAEIPEVYVKLMEMGYSRALCKRMVVDKFQEFKWKHIRRSLARQPLMTISVLGRYVASLWRVQRGARANAATPRMTTTS